MRFVLGLRDGEVSMYQLCPPSTSTLLSKTLPPNQPRRISTPARLHSAAMGGVCAADFLPGYLARIVSVGFDSRCRITDFECAGDANILRTWSIDGQATCLSVSRLLAFGDQSQCFIAIGTVEGQVGVYNVLGLLVHEIRMEDSILGIQWVGDVGLHALKDEETTREEELATILRVAPALEGTSAPLIDAGDLSSTPPTRISPMKIPRRPTRRRPCIRGSTFKPPTLSGHSARTSVSLQEAEPISIEDGSGTQFFTPPSTQRIRIASLDPQTPPTSQHRAVKTAKSNRAIVNGSVYSPPTRSSSLSTIPTPLRRRSEEKKRVDVQRRKVGVHTRRQTETPEWLTPQPLPIPTPGSFPPFPFHARVRSPPSIPRAPSTPPHSSPRDENESRLVGLRKDHEELKVEVEMLRREVSEIKALLSSSPYAQVQTE